MRASYYNDYGLSSSAGTWAIITILVAICGGIVLYFTFLNENNAKNYTGFVKKLYDFLSFSKLSLEAILKIFYLVIAIYITLSSFSIISTSFVAFLLYLFVGNILARIIFESALLIIMIYHKLNAINEKLEPKKDKEKKVSEEK